MKARAVIELQVIERRYRRQFVCSGALVVATVLTTVAALVLPQAWLFAVSGATGMLALLLLDRAFEDLRYATHSAREANALDPRPRIGDRSLAARVLLHLSLIISVIPVIILLAQR